MERDAVLAGALYGVEQVFSYSAIHAQAKGPARPNP